MDIRKLVLFELPSLSLKDSGIKALALMRDFHVYHLPVIDRDDYLALISEEDLLDWDTPEEPLSKAEFLNFRPAVFENMHPIEAIKLIKEFHSSVIPLLDENRHFMGCLTKENLFDYITNTNSFEQEGGIIVINVSPLEYSLAEIARLAESNSVTLQGVLVRQKQDENMLHVTLKTNRTDLRAFVATLERYEYHITSTYNANLNTEELKDNYDLLMRYLDL